MLPTWPSQKLLKIFIYVDWYVRWKNPKFLCKIPYSFQNIEFSATLPLDTVSRERDISHVWDLMSLEWQDIEGWNFYQWYSLLYRSQKCNYHHCVSYIVCCINFQKCTRTRSEPKSSCIQWTISPDLVGYLFPFFWSLYCQYGGP